ncbi:hypothetical protein ATANTOWER_011699 [Ataeniobius toweri]|uniref:Uncharacterized protein n=1 Tax=Ataeniobius toweri TaxID=208326 RepID=A0ABU7AKC3_9TELE|nr:hypothetical protein [Ataeniobius toweri]
MIIGRSIRGRITRTSLPECFAYSGSKSSQRLCLVTDRFQTLEDPGSSSSWQSASLGTPSPHARILSSLQRSTSLGSQKLQVDS